MGKVKFQLLTDEMDKCAHNAYNVQRPEKGDSLAGRDAVNADVHHSRRQP